MKRDSERAVERRVGEYRIGELDIAAGGELGWGKDIDNVATVVAEPHIARRIEDRLLRKGQFVRGYLDVGRRRRILLDFFS